MPPQTLKRCAPRWSPSSPFLLLLDASPVQNTKSTRYLRADGGNCTEKAATAGLSNVGQKVSALRGINGIVLADSFFSLTKSDTMSISSFNSARFEDQPVLKEPLDGRTRRTRESLPCVTAAFRLLFFLRESLRGRRRFFFFPRRSCETLSHKRRGLPSRSRSVASSSLSVSAAAVDSTAVSIASKDLHAHLLLLLCSRSRRRASL